MYICRREYNTHTHTIHRHSFTQREIRGRERETEREREGESVAWRWGSGEWGAHVVVCLRRDLVGQRDLLHGKPRRRVVRLCMAGEV